VTGIAAAVNYVLATVVSMYYYCDVACVIGAHPARIWYVPIKKFTQSLRCIQGSFSISTESYGA